MFFLLKNNYKINRFLMPFMKYFEYSIEILEKDLLNLLIS